jgi:lipopolysaccharide transport system ATP-binding protein
MYMRLAFAVAAHLEPEILIVDEVLAVGDAEFQKKCLGKMSEVAQGGRTVLFVSHNMHAIHRLCRTAACLDTGRLVFSGDTPEAVSFYQRLLDNRSACPEDAERRPGTGELRVTSVRPERSAFRPEEEKVIVFSVAVQRPPPGPVFLSVHILDSEGQFLAQCDSRLVGVFFERGPVEGELVVRAPWLKPGDYQIDFFLCATRAWVIDQYERACVLRVSSTMPYAHSAPDVAFSQGCVLSDFSWRLR